MSKIEIVGAVVVILIIVGALGAYYSSAETMNITIEDKWIKPQGDETKYLIETTDNGVMCVIDSVYFLSFDASDRYSQLEVGETYEIKKVGWRIPILSKYENVLEIYGEE
jgi:hypothetical protein